MLVHLCEECGKVSINRIAADDDNGQVMSLVTGNLDDGLRCRLDENGIAPIESAEIQLVRRGLFGLG